MTSKLDIHHHVLPPFWVEYLRSHPSEHRVPAWSPEADLESMDRQGIATAYLSLSVPGVLPWPAAERPAAARQVNEYVAALMEAHPGRYGSLATLPLPDVDASIAELRHAVAELGARGAIVYTSYGDTFLGDETFDPLWAELDAMEGIVLVHPDSTTLAGLPGVPASLADFPFATTRTALHMVLRGVLTRFPRVRFVLAHAGGFLPYTAERFAIGGSGLPGAPSEEELMALFKRFWFDTALSTGPGTLRPLTAFADPDKVLFGSDYPYAAGKAEEFTATLDATDVLDPGQHEAVCCGNAAAILGTTSGRPAPTRTKE